ncbi:trypsin-like peptidase [Kribbella orskensis]|uniref:Trypsin-like peptidase n=1 Tax=Kribbella orskensis TaxID=2512216 RepID=A0ABY2BKK5_9ACTN|nr:MULTISPECIES: S1C family serine protease [Kribbella]TCN40378.1 trypsin-like peptidase [Kribbella sp. VKM Ac-2500]TCO22998.1 trypsin-like peptidase [Kribbella orskensis]
MNIHPTRRIAALTAATMVLSFATIVPAASAPARLSADPQWPDTMPYDAYGTAPDWYSVVTPSTAALDTATATADEQAGLVLVSTTLAGDSGTAAGTGMVIDEDGIVLTNHHVVEGSDSIKVTVATTDTTYTARVLGTDAVHDIAVLQLVGADNLTTVTPDSTVAVGDEVTAVGDANGDGGNLTASAGSVTALAQSITVQGEDGTPSELDGLIEVDADVIAGDSGGALLDADGQVVGMTTAASSGFGRHHRVRSTDQHRSHHRRPDPGGPGDGLGRTRVRRLPRRTAPYVDHDRRCRRRLSGPRGRPGRRGHRHRGRRNQDHHRGAVAHRHLVPRRRRQDHRHLDRHDRRQPERVDHPRRSPGVMTSLVCSVGCVGFDELLDGGELVAVDGVAAVEGEEFDLCVAAA